MSLLLIFQCERFFLAGDWDASTLEHHQDEDISPDWPSDYEMSEDGDMDYNSMGEQGNADHAEHKATERANHKGEAMSRKVKTLFQSVGISQNHLSKKVGRLLKSRAQFLEPFMKAYVEAKSYLPAAKNAQVDGRAVINASSAAKTKKLTKPFDDETEEDDWGSGEPSTADYVDNEQQPDDGSAAADFEPGGRILDGEIDRGYYMTAWRYEISLLREILYLQVVI